MSDTPLQRVQAGDPLRFPAQTFNIFCDTAETVARMRRQFMAGVPQGRNLNMGVVTIRNDTGEDLDRFSVVGLGDPIIDNAANLAEFKNRITFKGQTPDADTHRGKFAILLEPIGDGKLGKAVVSGLCQVRIFVLNNETYQFADVKGGDTGQLVTGRTGAAQILWRETGMGEAKWAIVRLGTPISYLAWAKVQSGHVNYAFGTPTRVASVKLLDDDGDEYGDAFSVYLPWASGKHPALFAGDKILVADPVAGRPTVGAVDPVCVSDCSDDAFYTVKAFGGSVADIPRGWKLCDGQNGTTCDLRGRFIMGVDPDGQADENSIGDTGGFRKHGTTENNHDTHGNHDDHAEHNAHNDPSHTVTPQITLCQYDAGGEQVLTSVAVAHNAAQTDWSHAAHGAHSAHAAHSDSDNRPRYFVLAFMQRVE